MPFYFVSQTHFIIFDKLIFDIKGFDKPFNNKNKMLTG